MTRDDIIRMAREAGFMPAHDNRAERFAALVAAHVRENEFKPDWNNFQQGLLTGAAEEREACADFLEHGFIDDDDHNLLYAKEIRARGDA